jgi:HEAT repeat protein
LQAYGQAGCQQEPQAVDVDREIERFIRAIKRAGSKKAVLALKNINDPRVVSRLIDELKDSDWKVRHNIARALQHINDPRATEPVMTALKSWLADAPRISEGRSPLANFAPPPPPDPQTRSQAWSRAIGGFSDRTAAIQVAIGMVANDHRSVETLITALKAPEDSIVKQAVITLKNLKDTRAVEPLIGVLESWEPQISDDDAIALGPMSTQQQLLLNRSIESRIRVVQTAATDALTAITGQNLGQNPQEWRNWLAHSRNKKKPGSDSR